LKKNFTWTPKFGLTEKQIEKELARQVSLIEEKVRTGRLIDGTIKFGDFAEKWMTDYAEKQLAPKTVHRYKGLLVRIMMAIGHIKLDNLQPIHLMDFYDNLSESGIREDKKYSMDCKLANRLNKQGYKPSILAKKANISSTTASNALNGKNISEASALAIGKSLNIKFEKNFILENRTVKLASRTILHHHRLISSILETAVQWQIIFSNPADRLKAPRVVKTESKFLDDYQAMELVAKLENQPIQLKTMIILLIYTGLRRGELCGLKWSDLDINKKILHVKRALQYLPKKGLFEKEPKSATSIRTIKISGVVIEILVSFKAWQDEERIGMGDFWQKEYKEKSTNKSSSDDYMFTRWNGSPFYPDNLTNWFRKFNQENTLLDINIHSLRHTNASLMIAAGTDIRTVSKRLGHAQTSTTANIYAHSIRSADEAAAETIENILDPRNLLTQRL
jgi:integrase